MKVRYIGPHQSGVEVVMPDGQADADVEYEGILETTAEHAKALLEQPSNWEKVEAPKKASKPKAASKSKAASKTAAQTAATDAADDGGNQ